MELVKLFLIISLGIPNTNGGPSPKFTWPLCDKSLGFEVIEKHDGIYPTSTDCFEYHNGPQFTSTTTTRALHFNGWSASSYVELSIPSGFIPETEFGISLYIYPEELRGTLLYYKADSTAASDVTDVMLSVESDGKLHFELKDSSGTSLSSISHGPVSIDSWTLVQFGYSQENSKTYLNVGGSSAQNAGSGQFKTGGTMYFGRRNDATEPYHGSVTCVLMFDKAADFPTTSETNDYCEDPEEWASRPPITPDCHYPPTHSPPPQIITEAVTTQDAPTTQISTETPTTQGIPAPTTQITTDVMTTLSQSTPVHLWPLDDKALTQEVISQQPPYSSALSLCPRIQRNNSVFPFPSLYFDGASISYIRTNLNQTFLQRNFTIGLFLCLDERDSGTVLYVNDNQVSGTSRLKIQTNWNNVTVTTSNIDGAICGEVLGTNLEIRQWNTLIVTRNTATGTLQLNINDVTSSTNDNCATGDTSQPSEIYIGTDTWKEDSFRGYLRCLTIFDDVVDSPDLAGVCQATTVTAYSAPAPPCPARSVETGVYFRKSATNKKPNDGVIYSTVEGNKKRCGGLCSTFSLCRSFVFELQTGTCHLYDYVTKQGLVEAPGYSYYTIVDRT
ncbi:uncharacterized protein LOC130010306 [Patella vulgata]|uniref:uncharacterized protein LOC130010306 n=1 Tax=Patella vulgata TaxID=6465 RepID=UPI0024A81DC4|nr:uncharacterized protein LOC130010306 [Patella vulgata]